jgi:hypothetical protein
MIEKIYDKFQIVCEHFVKLCLEKNEIFLFQSKEKETLLRKE